MKVNAIIKPEIEKQAATKVVTNLVVNNRT